ncbi:MAG TPA: prepilin peptidase [Elusimicrobia bacterium]|nr:prepilin peptidase [Elusimicrobiota bacterium]
MILAAAFVFGLIIGSFLNVCICRLPQNISIIKPSSRCPECMAPIKFYDNIPVISFLLLRGRCRNCAARISLKYPTVELFTAFLTTCFAYKWYINPIWLAVALSAVYLLIIAALIDFETMLIADIFAFSLAALGLAGSFINPYFSGTAFARLQSFLIGAGIGAGVIWLMAFLGKKIYKKDAVGEGDIFLMAGIGALIGWQGVLTTLIMASFFGSAYGLTLMLLKKAERLSSIPFGPFLAMGAVINLYSLVKPEFFLFF